MSERRNPWKLLESRTVYENPWIRVEDHQVVTPAGGEGQYGKVCFKSRAVAVIPIDASKHIFLVGQYRYTLDEYSWELPMGGAALDEPPIDAAKRELKEETGLSARTWRPLMRLHTSNSVTDEVGHVFVAADLRVGAARPEATEKLRVRRIEFDEAVQWALNGSITDAISVAGILHFALSGGMGVEHS
jgi:ADP-ribose pyrophosphatase